MRGQFAKILCGLLSVIMLSACGSRIQEDAPAEKIPSVSSQSEKTQEKIPPENYVVTFDMNTTADASDDESYEYEATTYDENWTPITSIQKSVVVVPYSESAILETALPAPERDGFVFAGWQTRPIVEDSDLVNGVSPYQWRFGPQRRGDATGMPISQMESLKEDGTATLYARWVKVKDISTEEELRAITNDLYGAYRLTADIELTKEWIPIGRYFNNYEYYDTDWWTYAFRGSLDGNGHTISGLVINSAKMPVEGYGDTGSPWFDDGNTADGCAAMFGASTSATIQNLILEAPVVKFAFDGDYCYGATVSAFDMASTVTNVTVNNPTVEVSATDETGSAGVTMFVSVSGMLAGSWNSKVTDCSVCSGSITVNAQAKELHGGEAYIGGMIGECYGDVIGCSASAAINVNVADTAQTEEDTALKVQAGGLNASNNVAENCIVDADIHVAVDKPQGLSTVSVGGMSGVQRYSVATANDVKANISLDCNLDENSGVIHTGAVAGSLDAYYTTQILLYTPVAQAGCTGNTFDVTVDGAGSAAQIGALPEIDGQPVQWINKGVYTIQEGFDAPSNIEAIAEKYGSYIPVEMLQDGIIWIVNE